MKPVDSGDTTTDAFLGGRVRLLQPRRGHRVGLDAALLQALVPAETEGLLVDLGTGVGAIAFSLAARLSHAKVIGVENNPAMIALGRAALDLPENAGFAGRVTLLEGDVTARRPERETYGLADGGACWVLMNPPFAMPDEGRVSPDPHRAAAHVGDADTLANWIRTASGLLGQGGRLGIVHRADALPRLLQALGQGWGAIAVIAVHPHADEPANRVLVTATKGNRAPFRLAPPLVLHESDGRWTEAAGPVLAGEASLTL
ncbi:tRNA1(Val) A37 N6-methylase TrmN6 [Faunimonas pinastri]|uniref:tRNA1(Val) A37 N6-methylase TrmN6 n=1 Tax=Faunimonas pinastri TaxID=1855383 RepID=A0A1H8ZTN3_9HYPH|nr:methyltransferase [Faunimonas pinastri]SEP67782.1 tRNA1(Val) A37 N6-methylase TrmN6 [Faunimonas pinastri]